MLQEYQLLQACPIRFKKHFGKESSWNKSIKNSLPSVDIIIAISDMMFKLILKCELNIHVSHCNCDVHRRQVVTRIIDFSVR